MISTKTFIIFLYKKLICCGIRVGSRGPRGLSSMKQRYSSRSFTTATSIHWLHVTRNSEHSYVSGWEKGEPTQVAGYIFVGTGLNLHHLIRFLTIHVHMSGHKSVFTANISVITETAINFTVYNTLSQKNA